MEKEKKGFVESVKSLGKNAKIAILAVAAILVVAVICVVIFAPSGETTFSFESSLKEVFENSEMSTAEYTYNSIAKVLVDPSKPEDEDNIKYHVSYKGTVKSGFDFGEVDIIEKGNTITVVVPKIEIQSVDV